MFIIFRKICFYCSRDRIAMRCAMTGPSLTEWHTVTTAFDRFALKWMSLFGAADPRGRGLDDEMIHGIYWRFLNGRIQRNRLPTTKLHGLLYQLHNCVSIKEIKLLIGAISRTSGHVQKCVLVLNWRDANTLNFIFFLYFIILCLFSGTLIHKSNGIFLVWAFHVKVQTELK